MMKIGFQGAQGAYSEEALYRYFGENASAVGYRLSEEACQALDDNQIQMLILPVENSIVGNVNVNMDLILKHRFFATGEVYLPINHCLMANPGVKLKDLQTAHSHPIALEQCLDFLKAHNIRPCPEFDTAGASKLLSERKSMNEGTIGSKLCAQYYGLEILAESIQNVQNNFTRFLILVKKIPNSINRESNKTFLAFRAKHHPGALLDCLQEFAKADINLTRLESRPIPENPFAYTFFIDFLGSLNDQKVINCLDQLKRHADQIEVLGSFPKGDLK